MNFLYELSLSGVPVNTFVLCHSPYSLGVYQMHTAAEINLDSLGIFRRLGYNLKTL
jgi:hypothetical protein